MTKPLTRCLQYVHSQGFLEETQSQLYMISYLYFGRGCFKLFLILEGHLHWTICSETETFLLIRYRTRFITW